MKTSLTATLYPSETPTNFTPATDTWEYTLRDVMIPMRDGVKLHTIILVPKGASHAGMLLTRTPYEAKTLTSHTHSGHLGPMLQGYDNATDVILEDGYIRVVQGVRGRYGSEGDYVMNRARPTEPPWRMRGRRGHSSEQDGIDLCTQRPDGIPKTRRFPLEGPCVARPVPGRTACAVFIWLCCFPRL